VTVPIAGLVLCGGASRRMGQSKAHLQIDSISLLQKALNALQGAGCHPLAVACAPGQILPKLSDNNYKIIISEDINKHAGPLAGLQSGLAALQPHAHFACVIPCDLPRITPQAITRLLLVAQSPAGTIPVCLRQSGHINPLVTVYPCAWHAKAATLLQQNQTKALGMLENVANLAFLDEHESETAWLDCDTPEAFTAILTHPQN
jgi:molybdopterin-guanine dinucleotide biosynthesis protein A